MNGHIQNILDMNAAISNTLITGRSINIQIGSNAGDTMTVDFDNTVDPNNYINTAISDNTTPGSLCTGASEYLSDQQVGAPNVAAYSGSAAGVTRGNINDIDVMIKNTSRMASVVAKYNARLTAAYDKIQDEKFGYSAYQSQVQDTDYAQTISTYAKDQIRQRSATSILTQANAQVGFSLNLLP
jgi:flagellin-like hook-associated protein FlgL